MKSRHFIVLAVCALAVGIKRCHSIREASQEKKNVLPV